MIWSRALRKLLTSCGSEAFERSSSSSATLVLHRTSSGRPRKGQVFEILVMGANAGARGAERFYDDGSADVARS